MTIEPLILDLPGEADTARLGEDLAIILRGGDRIALHGDLGMGKSSLARALIRALSDEPDLEVPSPTFTLVQTYSLRFAVAHVDLYRLSDPEELEELGLEEEASEGIILAEWPERAPDAFDNAIHIHLSEKGEGREALIEGTKEALARIRHTLAIRAFLNRSGHAGAKRRYMLGDASTRAYEIIESAIGERYVLMDAPARRNEPLLQGGLPYSRIACLAQSVHAFVGIANGLRAQGFSAPHIYAQDLDAGLLLTEHMGDVPFLLADGSPDKGRYIAAGELLAAMHEKHWPMEYPVDSGIHHALPIYDRAALVIETELLADWYFPFVNARAMDALERAEFAEHWAPLIEILREGEQSLVLRDYHSPNLIWRENRSGFDRLGIIDMQDAAMGPVGYDVSSLGFDARVTVSEEIEQAMLDAYCAARGPDFDRAAFELSYAITAAQRNTKLLGIFVRLAQRDGKLGYLRHLPRVRMYLKRILRHPALHDLKAYYEDQGFLVEETP